MSQAVAYGSISIIDVTDLGEFSVQPMSNLPLNVIYDPNELNSYTPNWGTNNLQISLASYYAGIAVTPTTVRWYKQFGTGGRQQIVPVTGGDEQIDQSGTLRILANQFTDDISLVTYIVEATYTEPTSQQALNATGQITFSLIKHASNIKDCIISGDSVIKYESGVLSHNPHIGITLTVRHPHITAGASGSGWKYQHGNNWYTYPESNPSNPLTVYEDDTDISHSGISVFEDGKCVIKFVTDDPDVYDIHTITKLYDGAPGDDIVSAILTNESQMVPVSKNAQGQDVIDYGTAANRTFTTRIIIYEGGTNVTYDWIISAAGDANTQISNTGSDSSTHPNALDCVAVTGMNAETGNVTFTCTPPIDRPDYAPITKTFSLAKVRAGVDGTSPTIYSVEADSIAVNKSVTTSGSSTTTTYTPQTIVFRGYEQTGNSKNVTSGQFRFYANMTYAQYKAQSTDSPTGSSGTTAVNTYTLNVGNFAGQTPLTSILCVFFKTPGGAIGSEVDVQSVIITSDGAKGDRGDEGKGAVNVIFGNSSDVLKCDSTNHLLSAQTIRIPFTAYEGITERPCSVSTSPQSIKIANVTPTVTASDPTTSPTTQGSIVWNLPQGTEIPTASGGFTINFNVTTSDNVTATASSYYSWTRDTASLNGENAVLLQIYTPGGTNVFNQNIEKITMEAILMDGSQNQTQIVNNNSWAWYKWVNGQYTAISQDQDDDPTKKYTISIPSNTVDSYGSYKCSVMYTPTGSSTQHEYTAYFALFDKTDPIQVSVFSSIGEQIVNNNGIGALYVRVTRLGQEIDPLRSDRFLTSEPEGTPSSGDYYYHLNAGNRSAVLKKYTNGSWVTVPSDADDYPKGTYTWTWRDKNGDALPMVGQNQQYPAGNNLPREGKVVYIDGSMIDTKIIADVGVTIS